MVNRGVYFLANNRIYNTCVVFLNSFRTFNPEVPLCLLPFNDNTDRIEALSARYAFSVFPDQETLSVCDQMSEKTMGRVLGHFRKLAMWGPHAPFDEFIYIDVDMVVLKNISFAWEALSHCDFTTSHSNMPRMFQFVWKESARSQTSLSKEQLEFSANTGFMVSRRDGGKIWDTFQANFPDVLKFKINSHMQRDFCEQPLLNYLIVTSGRPYSSLKVLGDKLKSVAVEVHGGYKIPENDRWITPSDYAEPPYFANSPVFLIHWAGFPYDPAKWPNHSAYNPETQSFINIYRYFENLDVQKKQ